MSTTHRCVSQENETASCSYLYYIPQRIEQHHRVHVQQLKVVDLFLKNNYCNIAASKYLKDKTSAI